MGIRNIGDALPDERKEKYLDGPISNEDLDARKAAQEQEKDEARKAHNERTGGHPVEVGQTDQARIDHNERGFES